MKNKLHKKSRGTLKAVCVILLGALLLFTFRLATFDTNSRMKSDAESNKTNGRESVVPYGPLHVEAVGSMTTAVDGDLPTPPIPTPTASPTDALSTEPPIAEGNNEEMLVSEEMKSDENITGENAEQSDAPSDEQSVGQAVEHSVASETTSSITSFGQYEALTWERIQYGDLLFFKSGLSAGANLTGVALGRDRDGTVIVYHNSKSGEGAEYGKVRADELIYAQRRGSWADTVIASLSQPDNTAVNYSASLENVYMAAVLYAVTSDGAETSIEVSNWICTGSPYVSGAALPVSFDGKTPGVYTFVPLLRMNGERLAEGLVLPSVEVTVRPAGAHE